jgi:hypothetical protein
MRRNSKQMAGHLDLAARFPGVGKEGAISSEHECTSITTWKSWISGYCFSPVAATANVKPWPHGGMAMGTRNPSI